MSDSANKHRHTLVTVRNRTVEKLQLLNLVQMSFQFLLSVEGLGTRLLTIVTGTIKLVRVSLLLLRDKGRSNNIINL
jgi:hypothetical protein